jgi:hypothetical protein
MANIFMLDYLNIFPMGSPIIKLLQMVSFFGSLINNILVFFFILQIEPKGKLIKGLLVFIVFTNYFFFSIYTFSLTGILVSFFGPTEQATNSTILAIGIIRYILTIAIMIAQIILIKHLDTEEEYYLKTKNI